MTPTKHLLWACVLLAACDGNPFVEPTPPVDPGPTDAVYPAQLKGSLGSATLSGGTLQVTLLPFDAPAIVATFQRAPDRDISGYEAYVPVADPLVNRNYIAYRAVIDGAVAIAVGDGGRGVDAFGGTSIATNSTIPGDVFVGPTTGLATYRGGYAGLRVRGDGSVPAQDPDQITGDVEVNADFGDGMVEGSISNRINTRVGLDPAERALDDRFLKVTDIDTAKGSFAGVVTTPGDQAVGSYAGAFAGNGQSVVGAVAIDAGNTSGYQDDVTEYGVFALPCVQDDPAGSACP